MHEFTIGADPEICLCDKSGNLKSAIPFIEGTKQEPTPLPSGGNIQRDNVACEFGIVPAETVEGFIKNVQTTMREVLDYLPNNLRFFQCASVLFPETELDCDEAKQFGCDPDYNAWNLGMVNTCEGGDNRANQCLRSFGGHVHIGYVPGSGNDFLLEDEGRCATIAVMDTLIGTRSVLLDKSPGSAERRALYGQAGAFRPTVYGVEHRSLSNFWIFDEKYMKEIYRLAAEALRIVREGKIDELFSAVSPKHVIGCINNSDKGMASNVWKAVKNFLS